MDYNSPFIRVPRVRKEFRNNKDQDTPEVKIDSSTHDFMTSFQPECRDHQFIAMDVFFWEQNTINFQAIKGGPRA